MKPAQEFFANEPSGLALRGALKTLSEEMPDMYCPQARLSYVENEEEGAINFWKSSCRLRQEEYGTCHNTTCQYGIAVTGIAHVPKRAAIEVFCWCGKKSIPQWKQTKAKKPICAEHLAADIARRKAEEKRARYRKAILQAQEALASL